MTRESDAVAVLLVACETNDRAPDEQRAMLNEALRLDTERGRFLSWREPEDAPVYPTLVAHVEATYEPSVGRTVSLTAAQRQKYDRLVARWARCNACGYPLGLHGADDRCPTHRMPGLPPIFAGEPPPPTVVRDNTPPSTFIPTLFSEAQ